MGETHKLGHELEVNQIELEMQNTELRRPRSYRGIGTPNHYDFAPVGYFTFDTLGMIREVNYACSFF